MIGDKFDFGNFLNSPTSEGETRVVDAVGKRFRVLSVLAIFYERLFSWGPIKGSIAQRLMVRVYEDLVDLFGSSDAEVFFWFVTVVDSDGSVRT